MHVTFEFREHALSGAAQPGVGTVVLLLVLRLGPPLAGCDDEVVVRALMGR